MGTDIHLYIEARTPRGWGRVRPSAWACLWCDGRGKYEHGDTCFSCKGAGTTTKEYHGRNYNLFAMLANVRNGTGFAGCDTGDGFVPLAEPRGLPDDTSIKDSAEGVKYGTDDYVWLGDHSFTFATLAEVLAYDYERTTKHRGVVNASEYAAWVEAGRKGYPKSYCGDVMGGNVVKVSQEELDTLIRDGKVNVSKGGEFDPPAAKDGISYYTTVEWESSYRESVGRSWFNFLDACKVLGKPEDVRFVFGFDS